MKSILDKTFRYTSSANTDLRKTFARIKRQQHRERVDGKPVLTIVEKKEARNGR